jgi:hydrogenase nickel incorporation protein HypA/HybF
MRDLVRKVEQVAAEEGAVRVTRVRVSVGALSHLDAKHFRDHFDVAARGTIAEGAGVEVAETGARTTDVRLESVEVE